MIQNKKLKKIKKSKHNKQKIKQQKNGFELDIKKLQFNENISNLINQALSNNELQQSLKIIEGLTDDPNIIFGSMQPNAKYYIKYLSENQSDLEGLKYYYITNLFYVIDVNQIQEMSRDGQFAILVSNLWNATLQHIQNDNYSLASQSIFSLANIFQRLDLNLYDNQLLNTHKHLIQILQNILPKLKLQDEQLSYGLLWLLNNLIHLSDQIYVLFDVMSLFIPIIQNQQNKQLQDDLQYYFLDNISILTNLLEEDLICELFNTHLDLMLLLVTHQWNPKQFQKLAEIFVNVTSGGETAQQQFSELGLYAKLPELLNYDDIYVQENILDCLYNIFTTDDQYHVEEFLVNIEFDIMKYLFNSLESNNIIIIASSSAALRQLLLSAPNSFNAFLENGVCTRVLQQLSRVQDLDEQSKEQLIFLLYDMIIQSQSLNVDAILETKTQIYEQLGMKILENVQYQVPENIANVIDYICKFIKS
ncbi:hypothetical protein pb186bvf_012692 [Paramecium bursaria]